MRHGPNRGELAGKGEIAGPLVSTVAAVPFRRASDTIMSVRLGQPLP